MGHRIYTDGELDGLLREHFRLLVEKEMRETPPPDAMGPRAGKPRSVVAPILRAAGLATAAALCLWIVGSGWGRSPLPEDAARFAAANRFPQRIGEGLQDLNRILSVHFIHGGER